MQQPGEPALERDVHVDDDVLHALEAADRLVVELDAFFGVDAALVERERQ